MGRTQAPPRVIPPAPPDTRALGRAAWGALAANLLACLATLAILGALPGSALEVRRQALASGALGFRLAWLSWVPASLSYLVFLAAWSRAARPGGLAAAALPLGTVAVALDVLAEVAYAFALPRALAAGSAGAVELVDQGLLFLVSVPANSLYALAFLLLALRCWRSRRLPRPLLLGLAPLLTLAAATTAAGLAERGDLVRALVAPWFLAMMAWWVALGRWCAAAGDPRVR